jgi:hypothetical protein
MSDLGYLAQCAELWQCRLFKDHGKDHYRAIACFEAVIRIQPTFFEAYAAGLLYCATLHHCTAPGPDNPLGFALGLSRLPDRRPLRPFGECVRASCDGIHLPRAPVWADTTT